MPNISGYSPLLISRVSELMQIGPSGSFIRLPQTSRDRSLDLMAVRYLFMPPSAVVASADITWGIPDIRLSLGAGDCAAAMPATAPIDFGDSSPVATEIGMVASLGCAVTIPDGVEVAKIEVTDAQGNMTDYPLLAGRDVAETSYDCPDVRSKIQHQRPPVFRDIAMSPSCSAYQYVKRFSLPQPTRIRNLRIKWTYPAGVLQVHQMSLFDRVRQITTQVGIIDTVPQWQKPTAQSAGDMVYVNQQAMPRAWLASSVIALTPAQVLSTIRTSKLPDGRLYQPEAIALVEDPKATWQGVTASNGQAEILKLDSTEVKIKTRSTNAAFLILGDVSYPGWQATIDGKPTEIYQTNYIQRGVQVPAGEHLVEYRFEPLSFKLGVGVTLLSAAVGVGLLASVPTNRPIE
jgi:Bacterial membrane protein YfhO